MAANNAPNGPAFIQANQHSSQVLRQLIQSIFATAGVINAGDLAVTALGTPNMSVNVAAGFTVLPGTQVTNTQGSYHVYNDATVNLGIAAANATNPRIDIVVASLQDAAYSGTNNQWVLQVITGTPAASPSPPATPANSVVLAQVSVPANQASITSGLITDKRPHAILLGAPGRIKARMHLATGYTGTATGNTNEPIKCDTVTYDPLGTMVTTGASAKITVPVAGYYAVSFQAAAALNNNPQDFFALTVKNGTTSLSEGSRIVVRGGTTGDAMDSSGSDVVLLAANDFITVNYFNGGGNALTLQALGGIKCYLSVHLLSPVV